MTPNKENPAEQTGSENVRIPPELLQSVILIYLRNWLHKTFSLEEFYEEFSNFNTSNDTGLATGLTEDKFRYAIAILETEELIRVTTDENGVIIIQGIARDGLRLLRDMDREMAREKRHQKLKDSE